MKIEWEDQVYDLDMQAITLQQAMVTQSYLGTSIMKAFDEIAAAAKADDFEDTPELFKLVGALHWLMLAQAGKKVPIADLDFPLLPFMQALFSAMAENAPPAAEAEPDPTVPGTVPPAVSPSLPAPSSPNPGQEVGGTASGM